jgi:hypothetical protein
VASLNLISELYYKGMLQSRLYLHKSAFLNMSLSLLARPALRNVSAGMSCRRFVHIENKVGNVSLSTNADPLTLIDDL